MKKTMGETIAELRKERGMTQRDLAEQMNVTDKAVSKWERDLSCPDVHSIPKLAGVLGVEIEALMQITRTEKPRNEELNGIVDTVLKAIPVAMGVAVVVIPFIGELTMHSGFTMLGIGMCCLAVSSLRKKD